MFSAMLFAQDRVASKTIERIALESHEVCIYKTMNAFPSPYELTRLLNSFNPDIIFLDLGGLEDALAMARTFRVLCPQAAVIGYLAPDGSQQMEQAFESGVLEILKSPLTLADMRVAVERAVRKARPALHDSLLAFVPAKAGSGASTMAVNLGGCLASQFGQKVLVIDADVHSGLVSMLLKATPRYTVAHALKEAALLDGTLWGSIVAQAHGLDLLASPNSGEATQVSWAQYHQLLQFVRPRYDTVIVDLPEVVNDATEEIVRRAHRVFIVTTPELPSLALARRRCLALKGRGTSQERIGIVVNRWNKEEIELSEIERFLEEPVAAVFENDYPCVRRAIQEGRPVGSKSGLGKAFTAFAKRFIGAPAGEVPFKPAATTSGRFGMWVTVGR